MDTRKPALLDLDHLAAQSLDDPVLEHDLLRLFAMQCRELIPAITSAGAGQVRADAAHTLRGSAVAVGAFVLAGLCATLEAELGRGGPEPAAATALLDIGPLVLAAVADRQDALRGARASRQVA